MTKNKTLGEWIATSVPELKTISDTAQLEAQLMAAHSINQTRTWLLAHLDYHPDQDQVLKLDNLLSERLQNVPLPYLLGKWPFYGLDFLVSPAVLIPRPETELLVSEALNWLQNHPKATSIVDVGTGSGCIAISLLKNRAHISGVCVDISLPALKVAIRNSIIHQVDYRLSFVQSDLLSAISTQFDILCANLPYIPTNTLVSLPVRQFEPILALDGGADGLNFIRRLLVQSHSCISPKGLLLFEIEAGQGDSALQLACETFPRSRCQILADLAGLPRLLRIEVSE